jgi:hypothetical protein
MAKGKKKPVKNGAAGIKTYKKTKVDARRERQAMWTDQTRRMCQFPALHGNPNSR